MYPSVLNSDAKLRRICFHIRNLLIAFSSLSHTHQPIRRIIILYNHMASQGNETSLHSSIKRWYSLPGDRFEVKVDNFIVDIVRDNLLIEIQTRNFSAIKKKLMSLLENHTVRLVHPVPREKWIVRMRKSDGRTISRRRSPKKGRPTDLFDELVRIPSLINEEKFSIEVLIIKEEEIRCNDGKGSWRRRGVSIKDRKLIDVLESIRLATKTDFLRFLPDSLPQPFSSKALAKSAAIPIRQSRRITYCLKKMGAIKQVGKNGNELLFETSSFL